MSNEYATISIIGPTNIGKSSILSTLCGMTGPHIAPVGGQQVNFEYYLDQLPGDPPRIYMKIHDTPGFQNSTDVLETVKQAPSPVTRDSIRHACKYLCEQPHGEDFKDDLTAWTRVCESDILFYVINITQDPQHNVQGQASLELLRDCGKPVIAIFNFCSCEPGVTNYQSQWKALLLQKNVYWVCEYDAIKRDFLEEVKLLEKMAGMDPLVLSQEKKTRISESIRQRKVRENRRVNECRDALARLLFDVASYKKNIEDVTKENLKSAKTQAIRELCDTVYSASMAADRTMLRIWKLMEADTRGIGNREAYDKLVFKQSPEALAEGRHLSWKEIAVGAGLFIPAVVADLHGGFGAVTAAAIVTYGALFGRKVVKVAKNHKNGTDTVTAWANMDILWGLVCRHLAVLRALRSFGQAAEASAYRKLEIHPALTPQVPPAFSKRFAKIIISESQCLIENHEKDVDEKIGLPLSHRQKREKACGEISDLLRETFDELKPIM